jgi:hypothetical protein
MYDTVDYVHIGPTYICTSCLAYELNIGVASYNHLKLAATNALNL